MDQEHAEMTLALADAPEGTGGRLRRLASAAGISIVQLLQWLRAHPDKVFAVLAIAMDLASGQTLKAVAEIRALLGLTK